MNFRLMYLLFVLVLDSCYNPPSELDKALYAAGENKAELMKVLKHYENDSLKYHAACYLIENMPYHYYYVGKELENYYKYFEIYRKVQLAGYQLADSLRKAGVNFSRLGLIRKNDIEHVDSSFLVSNIDWAFKVWHEQPWGKNVSFDNFCEYILPYRIGDEPLEFWREDIYNKYNCLLDSLRESPDADNPLKAAEIVTNEWKESGFKLAMSFPSGPHIGTSVVEWKTGTCREMSDGIIYVLRALGIPAGTDFLVQQSRSNYKHFWTFTFDKKGNTYVFEPYIWSEASAHGYHKVKVSRATFSINKNIQKRICEKSAIHSMFRYPKFRDVSHIYLEKLRPIEIKSDYFYRNISPQEPVYICLSSFLGWNPIDFSYLYNGKVVFNNIGGDAVFILATMTNDKMNILTEPFYVDGSGNVKFYDSNSDDVIIDLFSKFNTVDGGDFGGMMLNGVIEGSNESSFNNTDTLFHIKETPYRLFNTVYSDSDKQYRYIRYRGADNTHCDIAELYIYDRKNDSVPLNGRIIGPSDCKSEEYERVFDGNPYTSFHYKNPDNGWVGLKLDDKHEIGRIVYVPRNRMNYINKGDLYELFYFNNGYWKSAGVKKAESDSLSFSAPADALFYLKNHSGGNDERIFEMKEGRQIFR